MATKLTLKELSRKEDRLAPGHRLCPGCGAGTIVRQILLAIDEPVGVVSATGCLEVSTTIYPYSSWRVPWIHNAFENAASTAKASATSNGPPSSARPRTSCRSSSSAPAVHDDKASIPASTGTQG